MSQRSHIAISGSTAICAVLGGVQRALQHVERELLAEQLLGHHVPERLGHEALLGQLDRQQVEHLVVGHALLLERDHLLGHAHDAEVQLHVADVSRWARTSSMNVSVSFFGCVYQSPSKRRTSAWRARRSSSCDLVGRAQVHVDRARVDGRERAPGLDASRSPRRRARRPPRTSRSTRCAGRSARPGTRRLRGEACRRARAARPSRTSRSAYACQRGPRMSASSGGERQLVGGGGQVLEVDLLGLVVEDRAPRRGGRGTRRGGGRRTGRARRRPRCTWRGRSGGGRRGPTSAAATRRCRGT